MTYGIPVTVLTRTVTGQDADNNDVYTDVPTTITAQAFDPGGSVERVQGQDQVTDTPTLFVPPGTSIGPLDRIVVNGMTYEVNGSPNNYANPFTGWTPGVAVSLKAVTG